MKKLNLPEAEFETAVSLAISGIGDAAKRKAHTDSLKDADSIAKEYADRARATDLYALPRVTGRDDPIIHGTLRKSDLTALYSQYFVPPNKPARKIYEEIKVSAKGKCPLCGGIGHVRTLDHYLPKANFPLYSVLPANLVPCCRDCNSDKLNSFSATKDGQTIHPYFDGDRFFVEKWISATVVPGDPPVVSFFVAPPAHWPAADRSRVASHFAEYGLGGKFSIEAAADLSETIQTRRTTLAAVGADGFSQYLAEKGQNPDLPINNWRRVMFTALSTDAWFCAQAFT